MRLIELALITATATSAWMIPTSKEICIDRRDFFLSTATKALSISTLIATNVDAAYAESTSAYSKVYEPDSHSMDGKVVVITGGNTGLGLESTKRLTKAGATVVFTSRDEIKGRKALNEVNQYLKENNYNDESSSKGKAMVVNLDLCDLENVKSFNKRLEAAIGKDTKVDVLMNNAGVMAIPNKLLTKDNFEKTFQTNYLGHFALTSSLLPMLSRDARVINVSSMGYQFGSPGLDLDNLNGEKEYGPWSSYGASKLENILFTNELQKRASESDSYKNLKAFSLHPGAVQTDLGRYLIGEEKFNAMKENGFSSWTDKVIFESLAKFVKTVEEGASTQVYLAAADISQSYKGKYFSDGKVAPLKAFALDDNQAKKLWSVSEKLTGVKFDF